MRPVLSEHSEPKGGTRLAPHSGKQENTNVWLSLALGVGAVAVGYALRRRRLRSSAIDVGAVSNRWVSENRADRRDPFM